jgi:chromosomal replication initiator protein
MLDLVEQRSAWDALSALAGSLSQDVLGDEPTTLLLHGPAGSGKSHLIRRFVDEVSGAASVEVADAKDAFLSERSTRQTGERFSGDPDVLVVEDVQHLPLGSVETLIRIFDDRQARSRPTLFTASTGPRHLRHRGDPYPSRLTSRLASGLVVAVAPPERESRRAALEFFLREAGVDVPGEVVQSLVEKHRTLRGLEGAVNQLVQISRLDGTLLEKKPLLEHFAAQEPTEAATVERIVQRVAKCFHVTPKEVRSRSRQRALVVPRHVSMYLARRLTRMSLQQIGDYFGGCDHGAVLHACRKMEKTVASDPQVGGTIRQLQDELS